MPARAPTGLHFSPAIAAQARPLVQTLFTQPVVDRFLNLVRLLTLLAEDRAAMPLSAAAPELAPAATDRRQIDRVLSHIHDHFAESVTITQLADIATLSPSGLHCTFLRHTCQTVSQYLI